MEHYQKYVWDSKAWGFVLQCSNCKVTHHHLHKKCPACGVDLVPYRPTRHAKVVKDVEASYRGRRGGGRTKKT